MPRYNKKDIDRKSNKPSPEITEGLTPDLLLNRANQTRRDDDVIRTKKRTLYDIDFAIKWYIDNEIRPQIIADNTTIPVPVIFANGEKWDNVRRLGYIRDEKGMLQSPLIMLKRSSAVERDNMKTLDVNRMPDQNFLATRQRYNPRNRYEDELYPIPKTQPASSETIYIVDIPKYMTIEYEMMLWCDFTTQLNDVVDQILPYGRYLWGNEGNRFATAIGSISFETINTAGEDRLVRATIPLTVQGTLLSEQEARVSTLKKMYSIKKVVYDTVLDVDVNVFESTTVPLVLQNVSQQIFSGTPVQINMPGASESGGGGTTINAATMLYITSLTDQIATYVNSTTVTVNATAAINPVTSQPATVNEFDIYINGQYIDKAAYTWSPESLTTQTIIFDTTALGYTIESADLIVINGRWS